MENKLIKGIVSIAAGSIAYRTFIKLRERKLQKEMYGEMSQVIEKQVESEES